MLPIISMSTKGNSLPPTKNDSFHFIFSSPEKKSQHKYRRAADQWVTVYSNVHA